MSVALILKAKGAHVETTRPDATLYTVVWSLKGKGIGAQVVSEDGTTVLGLISERDIIRGLAEKKDAVLASPVDSLMPREVAVCTPDTGIEAAALLMDARHIRHLPVVEAGRVIDMLSLRDMVAYRLAEAEIDADVLREVARASGGISGN